MASPKVEGLNEDDPNEATFMKIKRMGIPIGNKYIGIIDGDLADSDDNFHDLVIRVSQLASIRGLKVQWRIFDITDEGINK